MALSDEPVPAAVGHAEHGHRRDLDRPAIGPIVTSAVTVFGIVAAFVSVQNEPGKLWNLGAALISTVPIGVGAWIWRSAVPATRAGAISRIIGALTIFAALPLFWLGVIINPAKGETSAVPSPAPQSSASEFPSDTSTSRPSQAATDAGPAIDIRMH